MRALLVASILLSAIEALGLFLLSVHMPRHAEAFVYFPLAVVVASIGFGKLRGAPRGAQRFVVLCALIATVPLMFLVR